jgi:hypothetical protein
MKVEEILYPDYRLIQKANEQLAEDLIYEGLITSYPMLNVIELVNNKLKCQTVKLKKDNHFYYNCFAINAELNNFDVELLFKLLNQCGWYIALIKFYKNKQQVGILKKNITKDEIKQFNTTASHFSLKIEAKFDVQIDRKIWPKQLFCLAPKKVKSKILKQGLVPKSGKNLDNQPERIYLAFNKENLLKEMLPQLKRNDERYQSGTILITLDTNKLPDNVRLFDDINWPDDAVYTIVNIPKYAISDITDI